jgi:hypothetical protein
MGQNLVGDQAIVVVARQWDRRLEQLPIFRTGKSSGKDRASRFSCQLQRPPNKPLEASPRCRVQQWLGFLRMQGQTAGPAGQQRSDQPNVLSRGQSVAVQQPMKPPRDRLAGRAAHVATHGKLRKLIRQRQWQFTGQPLMCERLTLKFQFRPICGQIGQEAEHVTPK